MSILIKDMEMPGNCTDCWFRKTAWHEYLSDCQLCPFTGDTTPYLTRDKKCPLVPVPPHGRLIDADAAAREGWMICRDRAVSLTERIYEVGPLTDENDLPTIIPAEVDE